MKHGSGIWRGSKGDSYIGEWKFGNADGYGVHTWLNGKQQVLIFDLLKVVIYLPKAIAMKVNSSNV